MLNMYVWHSVYVAVGRRARFSWNYQSLRMEIDTCTLIQDSVHDLYRMFSIPKDGNWNSHGDGQDAVRFL
jgi:hypothetical protein